MIYAFGCTLGHKIDDNDGEKTQETKKSNQNVTLFPSKRRWKINSSKFSHFSSPHRHEAKFSFFIIVHSMFLLVFPCIWWHFGHSQRGNIFLKKKNHPKNKNDVFIVLTVFGWIIYDWNCISSLLKRIWIFQRRCIHVSQGWRR